MENNKKITSFTDLIAWKEGHILVLEIYKITDKFPQKEIFGLISQMRRCVISITSNIAEGFGRKSNREKIQFYFISCGSISELQNQLIIARDIHYIDEKTYNNLFDQSVKVHKIINGLIRKIKSHYL